MKASLLWVLLLVLGTWQRAAAQAPLDTTNGRFFQPVFPNVTVTPNVVYGSAVNYLGGTQTLLMDIYQPTGDASPERPVIIFAHGGGFVAGSRTDAYMVKVCTQFAKLGYVTASIEYRLGFPITGFPPPARDTVGVAQAAIRGMQDLRAAVRFFRADAAGANLYRASASRIAVGGSSAGAFAALEVGYLDKASEVPAYVGLAALGGIEGTSGNPGYNSFPLAVLNLSGATEQPGVIEPGNAPLYSAHGTSDATVPYLQGRVGSLLPPKYVYGSGRLNPYATSIGVPNQLRRFSKAGHVPFESTSAAGLAYADTVYRDMRAFLRPLLAPFATALPSLVINTNQFVPGGSYQDITINSGTATLSGNVTVYGTLVVRGQSGQAAGTLNTSCFVVDGPGNFDLQAGAMLRICDPDGISASGATGAIRNTGARTFSPDASYAYTGTGNQITGLGLPVQVREFEVNVPVPFTVQLTRDLSISQRFLPTSGHVLNSRALVLLSGPTGTALATPGAATLRSSLSFQRYLDPRVNSGLGYRHLALPFDFGGLTSVNAPAFTPEFNPAYNTAARPDLVTPFPNVYVYDQSRALTSPATSYSEFDKGWAVPVAPGGSLTGFDRGRGFILNITAGQTLDLNGPLTRNNEDIAVTLAPAATPTAGWHLVGNPFASAMSWDAVPVPSGMSGAMYIFVSTAQYAGNYRTYVNGMGSVGATIPLGQGFFVRSLSASPVTLTMPVSARITNFNVANTATVQRSTADTRPQLRLTLAAAATPAAADEAYLYQQAGATSGVDAAFDAVKLSNPSGLNLSTVAAGQPLAINGLPMVGAPTTIPLAVDVPSPGAYVLTADQLANYAPGAFALTDGLTGTRTPLAAGTRYAFTLAGTTAPGRFALELSAAGVLAASPAQALAAGLQVWPNPASGSFQVALPLPAGAAAPVVAELTNVLGQTVRRLQLATAGQQLAGEVSVRGLAPGVYQLHLTVAGTALVRRVVVE
ncbi:alpha/beta hydrolase fold domain-containing protein [Hymenobacter monticola]|uniref:Alpha/beta hydrolase fold domain-containing protein n=1 Tax=Hymenobacter monticola TaxID=1705399 RepID=A0ABY4B778_9BACT|nr:alpha/beta hydrolase fold domain-containing protein [Hymenobacter monticola]UOE35030.1 alpha/beta hydrolase fold domain-containing protein [Hymenobacter monticola]